MDDLLDLNWSAPAAPAARQQQPSLSKPPTPAPAPQFDLVARANGSGAGGRNYYPSASNTPALRPSTPQTAPLPSNHGPATAHARASNGGDAFSSLFNLASTASSSQTLSLAERQAQLAEEKRQKEEHERLQFHAEGSFWDNLASGSAAAAPRPLAAEVDDLLSPTLAPSRPASDGRSSVPSRSQTTIPWDDEDDGLLSAPSSSKPPASGRRSAHKPLDPFDFDALESAVPPACSKPASPPPAADEDEDLLGQLGRPAARPKPKPKAPESSRTRPTRSSSSPPPHIVGQIVEMGFSPAQARTALASTSTGQDVQAALESLLAGQQSHRGDDDSAFEDEDRVLREHARRKEEEAAERRRQRRAGPLRDSVKARTRDDIDQQSHTPRVEYYEQADKIIAQASEIGQNMFSKGISLWNSGKEKALKAYEEQKRAIESDAKSRRDPVRDGRPRWMVDAEAAEAGAVADRARPSAGGFKDSDDEESPRKPRTNDTRPAPSRQQVGPSKASSRPASPRQDLLFGDEQRPKQQSYQPASRRAPTSRQAPAPRAPPTPAPAPRAPLVERQLVPASQSQIQSAAAAKAKGNDHFKLGRFSEAEVAYSSAITALPDGHILLVNLYNNRASTRLKLGEAGGAATDATAVVELVGVTYHPSKEAPLPSEFASEVKLADALVKAFTKRAQAWEMAEKWSKAVEDWERLLGFDSALLGPNGAATRALASDGVRRSKKMLRRGETPKPKAVPRAHTAHAASRPSKPASSTHAPSKAVLALRQANEAAEREEAAKADAKADVDTKIMAWKTGKETNIRALISSLDMVLWDEILAGGLKVGIHEVITEKQVKIKYMKVIARLHPDKLSVDKTTVEQRMLANSAFSVLNEA